MYSIFLRCRGIPRKAYCSRTMNMLWLRRGSSVGTSSVHSIPRLQLIPKTLKRQEIRVRCLHGSIWPSSNTVPGEWQQRSTLRPLRVVLSTVVNGRSFTPSMYCPSLLQTNDVPVVFCAPKYNASHSTTQTLHYITRTRTSSCSWAPKLTQQPGFNV